MNTLTIYEGRKGDHGSDGVNGIGSAEVNEYKINNPILGIFHNNNLSSNTPVSFVRDKVSTYLNRYGKDTHSKPASATNYMIYSEDFTQWDDVLSSWSIIGSATDPFGGTSATEINLDKDTAAIIGTIPMMGFNSSGLPTELPVVASFYIKRISGNISSVQYSEDSVYYDLGSVSDEWERKVIKLSNNNASSRFGISPRGDLGARFAVYGVQINELLISDPIQTLGATRTINLTEDITRANQHGYLIEESKQNLARFSNDFKGWSVSGGEVITSTAVDPFGYSYSRGRLSFISLPTMTISATTEPLTESQIYNVSFYAYIQGGSLTSLTVSLGSGVEISAPTIPVNGYERISLKVTAGASDTISFKATSTAMNAQLNINCIQIEEGEVTSYIDSGTVGQSRPSDLVSIDYNYSAPLPSGEWSFIFSSMTEDNADVKTIFSNGEADVNEFSLTIQNRIFTLNNGGNTASIDLFDYTQAAITYDGADIKFYGENKLLSTQPLSSTSFTATNLYFGSNGTDNFLNGYLKRCFFYNTALNDDDIIYLLGV